MRARVRMGMAVTLGLVLVCVAGVRIAAAQQHVILDKPVHAGELTLYPSLDDKTTYYYLPDKIRLATDENGNPDFSFIRYVRNVRSTGDQPEAREGEGGGIVHATVMMSVSPEQLSQATRELQATHPGARIEGPVAYKAGRFGLVSAFADGKGGFSNQVLGLGSAPILDNEKASVSLELTQKGAIILWDAFNMANPAISFKFEMDAAGYGSPMKATIDADWSKIYSHRSFGAGVATSFLAAELKDTFDELRTQDAIKITQVGQDEKMDAVVATAYKMIQDRMFEPIGGTGTPSLTELTSTGQNQPSLLDRATARFKENKDAAAAANAEIRKDNDAIRARNDKVDAANAKASGSRSRAEVADRKAAEAEANVVVLERKVKTANAHAESMKRTAAKIAAQQAQAKAEAADAPVDSTGAGGRTVVASNDPVTTGGDDAAMYAATAAKEAAALQKELDTARADAKRLRDEATKAQDGTGDVAAGGEKQALREEQQAPPISIIATLEMKKIKQSGTFHFDMNKYLPDNRTFPFEQGIGSLVRLKSDPRYFRQINMDDPLFKQREIVAMVDGVNAQDFGQFVNFVDVQMRKKHQGGDITNDEVRVDRNNFNKEGNNFKLLYGWKGDDDRGKWMEYEVQSTWSLFGGKTVTEPWAKATSGAIDLHPPYRRRTVTLDGSPETLQAADVRAVTVQLFYDVAGAEQSKQLTLNVAKGQVGEKVDILTPPNSTTYGYQLTWQLKGNKTVSTPRQSTVYDILYVDDLPSH